MLVRMSLSQPPRPSRANPPKRAPRPAGPPPGDAMLRDAALTHLARFAATEAGLIRVLDRRIDRWRRAAEQEGQDRDALAAQAALSRQAARAAVAALARAGAISDIAFAESRVRSLVRSGRSRRAIAAHLAARGVPSELADSALPDDAATELGAALLYARRRRMGPFRAAPEADATVLRQELARMARAGFTAPVALRALRLDPTDAEAQILALRQA